MSKDIFIRTISLTEAERANIETASEILDISMNTFAQEALAYAIENPKKLKKEEKLEHKISVSLTDVEILSMEMLAESLETQPSKLWRQIIRLYMEAVPREKKQKIDAVA